MPEIDGPARHAGSHHGSLHRGCKSGPLSVERVEQERSEDRSQSGRGGLPAPRTDENLVPQDEGGSRENRGSRFEGPWLRQGRGSGGGACPLVERAGPLRHFGGGGWGV